MVNIMSPAGSYEGLRSAIKAGADSVYFGIKGLNMRSLGAKNFSEEDLPEIVRICRENNVESYLTLNTVIYDDDMERMKDIADRAKEAGVTAVICMDMAAVKYCNSIGLEVHTSTQLNISNTEAVRFYSQFADTVVLARELDLDKIRHIAERIREEDIRGPKGELVKIEIFVHGALCVSISGKCYMSLATYNRSANRGECLQTCRRKYRVIDDETGTELNIDNKYVMSPKDLSTIEHMGEIMNSGASVFKIEGRARSPEYVYEVTKAYREAADLCMSNEYTKEKAEELKKRLKQVFNRGFWEGGYYLGNKLGEWAGTYGSKAEKRKEYIGKAVNHYAKNSIGEFLLQSHDISVGEEFIITGPTTGIVKGEVRSLHTDEGSVKKAEKGEIITFPVDEKIRRNDKLYKYVERTE
ncbi:MAG: peptidase U32 family protein [Nanobdellota archaeon]